MISKPNVLVQSFFYYHSCIFLSNFLYLFWSLKTTSFIFFILAIFFLALEALSWKVQTLVPGPILLKWVHWLSCIFPNLSLKMLLSLSFKFFWNVVFKFVFSSSIILLDCKSLGWWQTSPRNVIAKQWNN